MLNTVMQYLTFSRDFHSIWWKTDIL